MLIASRSCHPRAAHKKEKTFHVLEGLSLSSRWELVICSLPAFKAPLRSPGSGAAHWLLGTSDRYGGSLMFSSPLFYRVEVSGCAPFTTSKYRAEGYFFYIATLPSSLTAYLYLLYQMSLALSSIFLIFFYFFWIW